MGRRPGRPRLEEEKLSSALALVEAGLPPARAARQLGIGRFHSIFEIPDVPLSLDILYPS